MTLILNPLVAAFSLGFDSLLAGLAIAPIVSSRRARAWFVALFGICDGVATLLGALAPWRLPQPPIAALYLSGAFLIILGVRRGHAWLYALPFLFSLDNLAAGGSVADAPALAASSAAMALLGFAVGGLGRWTTIQFAAIRAPI